MSSFSCLQGLNLKCHLFPLSKVSRRRGRRGRNRRKKLQCGGWKSGLQGKSEEGESGRLGVVVEGSGRGGVFETAQRPPQRPVSLQAQRGPGPNGNSVKEHMPCLANQ